MKKVFPLVFDAFITTSCCDCESFEPPRLQLDYFAVNQILLEDVSPQKSAVAFEIVLADSLSFVRNNPTVIPAAFFELSMEQCECGEIVLIANPVSKIAIFELINGEKSGSDISDRFVGNLTNGFGANRGGDYQKISSLLSDMKSYDIGYEGFVELNLFDTSEIKKPNSAFVVELELVDNQRIILKSPTFFSE